MKAILSFLAVSVVASSGLACPYLTGEWSCGVQGEKSKMVLTSIGTVDADYLIMTTDAGTSLEETVSLVLNVGRQTYKDKSYRAVCGSNNVTIEMSQKLSKNSEKMTDVKFSLAKLTSGTLVLDVLSSNDSLVDANQPLIECKKLSLLD